MIITRDRHLLAQYEQFEKYNIDLLNTKVEEYALGHLLAIEVFGPFL